MHILRGKSKNSIRFKHLKLYFKIFLLFNFKYSLRFQWHVINKVEYFVPYNVSQILQVAKLSILGCSRLTEKLYTYPSDESMEKIK